MKSLESIEALMEVDNPFDKTPIKSHQYINAIKELIFHNMENSNWLKRHYERLGFDPNSLDDIESLDQIPFISLKAFRYFDLGHVSDEEAVFSYMKRISSRESLSQRYNEASNRRLESALFKIFRQSQFSEGKITNYLFVAQQVSETSAEKGKGNTQNLNHLLASLVRFAPEAECKFADISLGLDSHLEVMNSKIRKKITEFAKEKIPLTIVCDGSCVERLTSILSEIDSRLELAPGSLVLTVNTCLEYQAKNLKAGLKEVSMAKLCVDSDQNIDLYFQPEIGIPLIECPNRRFHLPIYVEAIIRDFETMLPMNVEEIGLVQLLAAGSCSSPTQAILTEIPGKIAQDVCDCGYQSNSIEFLPDLKEPLNGNVRGGSNQ